MLYSIVFSANISITIFAYVVLFFTPPFTASAPTQNIARVKPPSNSPRNPHGCPIYAVQFFKILY